jgi:hypothetical protein
MPFLNWLACCCGSSEGACCLDADTCVDDLTTAECHDQGGEHFPGEDCTGVDCSGFEPTGACCYGETCVAPEYEDACKDKGGDWIAEQNCENLGSGTTICTDALGACCWCDGCYENISREVCHDDLGGTFYTSNDCSIIDCSPGLWVTGPCCLPDCTCTTTLSSVQCACIGGTFISGRNKTCSDCTNCNGACCIPHGTPGEPPTCTADQTPAECAALGGTFRGNGSDCTDCSGDSLNEGCADIMNVVPSGNYDCGYNATAECDTLNDAENKWPSAFLIQFEERALFGERDNSNLAPCYETGTSNLKLNCNDFTGVDGNCGDPYNCTTTEYPTWDDAGSTLRAEVFHVDKIRTVLLELDETESSLCEAVYYGTWEQDWEHAKTIPGLYLHGVDWPGGLFEIVRKQGGETGALTRTARATIITTATTDGTDFYRTAELLVNTNHLAGSVGFPAGDVLHGGSIVGWRTPQDDEYKINTGVPCFCFSPDLLNTETLDMFDPVGHVPDSDTSLSNTFGPDDPALPDALDTGIKRTYHGLIPGGGYNSDAAITTWCESPCISGAVHSEGNDCDSAQCCHGADDCDNMTLQGCIAQGGTWYPDHDCTGVDPCTDPSGPAIDCCGQCGCYRCHAADCTMSMTSCKTLCKGACFDPSGSADPCPTGHDHAPRWHYSEDYGPWLDQAPTYRHTVGWAVSYGLGSYDPNTQTCPAPDWMSICGWDSGGLWWPLSPSGHGLGGSDLLAQWVGYHCQAESTGVDERRPQILRIDWTA